MLRRSRRSSRRESNRNVVSLCPRNIPSSCTLLKFVIPFLSFSPNMRSALLFSLALATLSQGLPASEQLVLENGASKALNWGAGAISRVGGGDAHTMTRWSWNDCGE